MDYDQSAKKMPQNTLKLYCFFVVGTSIIMWPVLTKGATGQEVVDNHYITIDSYTEISEKS